MIPDSISSSLLLASSEMILIISIGLSGSGSAFTISIGKVYLPLSIAGAYVAMSFVFLADYSIPRWIR